jgi:hypothetical protein
MKTYWGTGSIAPRIFDLGTRWRWVVSFTPRLLYPRGKSPWYPFDRRLGGPQIGFEHGTEEKNSQPPPGIETPIIRSSSPQPVDIPTELFLPKSNCQAIQYSFVLQKCTEPCNYYHLSHQILEEREVDEPNVHESWASYLMHVCSQKFDCNILRKDILRLADWLINWFLVYVIHELYILTQY